MHKANAGFTAAVVSEYSAFSEIGHTLVSSLSNKRCQKIYVSSSKTPERSKTTITHSLTPRSTLLTQKGVWSFGVSSNGNQNAPCESHEETRTRSRPTIRFPHCQSQTTFTIYFSWLVRFKYMHSITGTNRMRSSNQADTNHIAHSQKGDITVVKTIRSIPHHTSWRRIFILVFWKD